MRAGAYRCWKMQPHHVDASYPPGILHYILSRSSDEWTHARTVAGRRGSAVGRTGAGGRGGGRCLGGSARGGFLVHAADLVLVVVFAIVRVVRACIILCLEAVLRGGARQEASARIYAHARLTDFHLPHSGCACVPVHLPAVRMLRVFRVRSTLLVHWQLGWHSP